MCHSVLSGCPLSSLPICHPTAHFFRYAIPSRLILEARSALLFWKDLSMRPAARATPSNQPNIRDKRIFRAACNRGTATEDREQRDRTANGDLFLEAGGAGHKKNGQRQRRATS